MDEFPQTPQQGTSSTSPSDSQSSSEERHISRPLNAFMLFRIWRNAQRMREYERLGVKPSMQKFLSKDYGAEWNALSKEEKDYWKRLAAEAKKRHEEQFPEYKYQPNKNKRKNDSEPATSRKRGKTVRPPGLPQIDTEYPMPPAPQWLPPSPGSLVPTPDLLTPSSSSSGSLSPSLLPPTPTTSHVGDQVVPFNMEVLERKMYGDVLAINYANLRMPRIASTSLPHLAARTRPTSGSQRPHMRPTTARPTTRLVPPSAPSHAGAAGLTNSQWGDVSVIAGTSASTQLQISVTQATAAVEETPSSAHGWNDIYAPLDAGFADFGAMIHGRIPTVHEQHERPYRPQQWSHPPPAQAFNYPPPADYPFSFSLPESSLNFSTQSTHMSRNAVPQTLPFYDARQPAAPVQMSTANVPTTSMRFSTTRPYVRDQGLATSSAPLNRPTEQFQPESELFAALGNAAGGSSAYLGSNQPVQGHSEFTDALGGPGLSSIASFDAITSNMYAAEAVAATTFAPSHDDIGVNLQGDYPPTAADHYSSDMALWFEQYLRDIQADSQSVGMPENPFATLPKSAVWPEEGSLERPNAGL